MWLLSTQPRIVICAVLLPDFDPDALTVWLFGPGVGELVVVRAPPDHWLVVDGCQVDGVRYAKKVLEHYNARPSIVVLSHPHQDHAHGVAEVVEHYTRGPKDSWPLLGAVPAPDTEGAGDVWDYQAAFDGRVAQQAIATMFERWRQHPACQWTLDAGTSQPLGDARVYALSPASSERDAGRRAFVAGRRDYNYNRAASAMFVRWGSRCVLLGSDLVEEPGGGWTAALGWDSTLSEHDVYKLAHHGALRAIGAHTERPRGAMPRTWIATPHANSGLPKARDGEALHRLLSVEDIIDLTGLPRPHSDQSARPEEATRQQLRDSPNASFPETTTAALDCYVMVTVKAIGPITVSRGPGSVRVRQG